MSSIKIRIKRQEGGCLLRVLIAHPMETGRRQDPATGQLVPAHFIQHVTIEHNGKTVASGQLGTGVSRDPYLALRLRDAQPGDIIRVEWADNLGQRDHEEAIVP